MRKPLRRLSWPFILVALLLVSCARRGDIWLLQQELNTVRRDVASLAKGEADLRREVAILGKKSEEELKALSQGRLGTRLDELMSEVRAIQGELEETNHAFVKLNQRLDQMDQRVSLLAKGLETLDSQFKALKVQAPPPVPPLKAQEKPAGPPAAVSPEELYRTALNDYARGSYELAISGFRSYLEWFPQTTLAPSTQYWLGEAYFSQGKFLEALHEFEGVVRGYPESPKVPSAMLKQGYAYLELKKIDQARGVFRELIKQFPKTSEARLARERLNEPRQR